MTVDGNVTILIKMGSMGLLMGYDYFKRVNT